MAGVKGAGGRVPKRSDQRRRTNKPAKEPTKAPGAQDVDRPPANSKWHPVAKRWYNSLESSGQSAFYQPSDWAAAYVLAESISRELKPQPFVVQTEEGPDVKMMPMPPKSASIAAWLKGFTALLATEGDRRRASLELQRPQVSEEGDDDVAWIDDARRRLRGSG